MVIVRRVVVGSIAGLIAGAPAFARTHATNGPVIQVRAAPGSIHGTLGFRGRQYACVLGRAGIVHPKHEGDGGTPAGMFPLREVRYRADRQARPRTGLPVVETKPDDGWCDEPADPAYNTLVHMPYEADAEVMWRDDHLYDLLAVVGCNDAPVVPGAGSAIFLHVARTSPDGTFLPTAGCVAMKKADLVVVLAGSNPGTMIGIAAI